jgi:hypothetical protein
MLLVHTSIEERAMTQLTAALQDVIKYLEKNAATVFVDEYELPGPAYLRAASA